MKLINTNEYLLLIDEKSNIKNYDLFIPRGTTSLDIKVFQKSRYSDIFGDKIIAYYPLKKEAKELDLPLLPNPFEEEVENLAKRLFPLPLKIHNRGCQYNSHLGKNPHKGLKKWTKAFIAGYKAAQSKQFSLEDIYKAFHAGMECIKDLKTEEPYFKLEVEYYNDFIRSLSTQQLPKGFILSVGNTIEEQIKNGYYEW